MQREILDFGIKVKLSPTKLVHAYAQAWDGIRVENDHVSIKKLF